VNDDKRQINKKVEELMANLGSDRMRLRNCASDGPTSAAAPR